jgi:phage gpG-like protein
LGKYGKRPGIAGAGRCLQGAEGMTATVTVNDAEFLALLETMKSRVTNLRPAMVDIGANLVSLIHDKLGIGMTPWGEAMKPLRYKRKHATKFGEGIPLNDTRMHIYQRITYRADTTSLSVGMLDSATAKIGQVHQFGAVIDIPEHRRTINFKVNAKTGKSRFSKLKKANFQQDVTIPAHSVTIPARPFMPIRNEVADLPTDWMDQVLETMRKHLTDK